MQKSKIYPVDSDRQLIVLVPVPGRKYWKHPEMEIFVDIELFNELVLKNGVSLLNKLIINGVKKVKKYLK